jgi:hypothetical protein
MKDMSHLEDTEKKMLMASESRRNPEILVRGPSPRAGLSARKNSGQERGEGGVSDREGNPGEGQNNLGVARRLQFQQSMIGAHQDDFISKSFNSNSERIDMPEFDSPRKQQGPTESSPINPSNREEVSTISKSSSRFSNAINGVYQSTTFSAILSVLIFLSMFLKEIWMMVFTKKEDGVLDIILLCVFFIFLLESLVNSLISPIYRFSFVFLLDTVSTLTIILDLNSLFFVSDADLRSFKQSRTLKILSLLSVLKLWRATRLFFRKNQTFSYEEMTHRAFRFIKAQYIQKANRRTNLNSPAAQEVSPRKEDPKTPRTPIRPVEIPKSKMDLKPIINTRHLRENQSNLKDFNQFSQGVRFELEEERKTSKRVTVVEPREESRPSHPVYEPIPTDEMDLFKKNKGIYLANTGIFSGLQKNKNNCSGNIRKTISYKNVGTIACTLLLTNLGLPIFLSSLYENNRSICSFDISNLEHMYMDQANFSVEKTDLFVQHIQNRLKEVDYSIIKFEVSNLYDFENEIVQSRRDSELEVCEGQFNLPGAARWPSRCTSTSEPPCSTRTCSVCCKASWWSSSSSTMWG